MVSCVLQDWVLPHKLAHFQPSEGCHLLPLTPSFYRKVRRHSCPFRVLSLHLFVCLELICMKLSLSYLFCTVCIVFFKFCCCLSANFMILFYRKLFILFYRYDIGNCKILF